MKRQNFSKVREAVGTWAQVRQLLRSGEQGALVPVVIPKDKRSYGFLFWFSAALYFLLAGVLNALSGSWGLFGFSLIAMLVFLGVGGFAWWRSAIVEIEQGTMGVMSSWGAYEKTPLPPGRRYLWWPWQKVEFIVDTSTEIPYNAPVLASPTMENVPLKSIEFFLRFKIDDPILFVRRIGAGNFDAVLSSAVQDAIRRRSRMVETSKAYDLRGSNVTDMQKQLNDMMQRYGIRILGANIPDVQLADQYQDNLATKEKVAKEQVAYEKEWDLTRKRRKDVLEMEIEQAHKERDAMKVAVREAVNKARQDVALMLQEKEAEAEKIRLNIEAKGNAELAAAQNEALALQRLGEAYQDNQAMLLYQLELRRLEVAEHLVREAPRPLVMKTAANGGGESSALTTLMLAQMLPEMMKNQSYGSAARPLLGSGGTVATAASTVRDEAETMLGAVMDEVRKRTKK